MKHKQSLILTFSGEMFYIAGENANLEKSFSLILIETENKAPQALSSSFYCRHVIINMT